MRRACRKAQLQKAAPSLATPMHAPGDKACWMIVVLWKAPSVVRSHQGRCVISVIRFSQHPWLRRAALRPQATHPMEARATSMPPAPLSAQAGVVVVKASRAAPAVVGRERRHAQEVEPRGMRVPPRAAAQMSLPSSHHHAHGTAVLWLDHSSLVCMEAGVLRQRGSEG